MRAEFAKGAGRLNKVVPNQLFGEGPLAIDGLMMVRVPRHKKIHGHHPGHSHRACSNSVHNNLCSEPSARVELGASLGTSGPRSVAFPVPSYVFINPIVPLVRRTAGG